MIPPMEDYLVYTMEVGTPEIVWERYTFEVVDILDYWTKPDGERVAQVSLRLMDPRMELTVPLSGLEAYVFKTAS